MDLHFVQTPPTRVPNYIAATSIDEALAHLGPSTKIIAGGTDLLVELDRGHHRDLETLLDLGRIPGLDTIEVSADRIRLGPMVTHNQVVASEACQILLLPLAQACREVGSPQLRNRATVAGNLVTASPANDTISALVALDATIELTSVAGTRHVPIEGFFSGFRETVLAPDEILTGISIPTLTSSHRSVYVKLGLRKAQAISVVHLAMVLDFEGDTVTTARLALGSVASTVPLVPAFTDALIGKTLTPEVVATAAEAARRAATPIDDLRAPADYRSDLVATMTKRALNALASNSTSFGDEPPMLWGDSFLGSFPTGASYAQQIGPGDTICVAVNGRDVTASAGSGKTLLEWLREEAELPGTKEGCAEGECGACTVHLDGVAVMSCLVPAARAHNADVVTVEGLASTDELHAVQEAFVKCGAVQCGFCTPGLLMACAKLLEEKPSPTRLDIESGLAGNLCRCTGYYSIIAAVEEACS